MDMGGQGMAGVEAIKTPDQVAGAPFGVKATFASAAAWSPNPGKPPLYLDLPVEGGKARPDVLARWVANAPIATVHQFVPELRRYHAIAMDAGAQDRGIAAATQELSRILTTYGIGHTVEIYDPGDHINRVDERVEEHASHSSRPTWRSRRLGAVRGGRSTHRRPHDGRGPWSSRRPSCAAAA